MSLLQNYYGTATFNDKSFSYLHFQYQGSMWIGFPSILKTSNYISFIVIEPEEFRVKTDV